MSDTVYSTEHVLQVYGTNRKRTLLEVLDYEKKVWVHFDPPFNVVYEKALKVGKRRNGGGLAYMRRKENVGKEQNFYSDTPTVKK